MREPDCKVSDTHERIGLCGDATRALMSPQSGPQWSAGPARNSVNRFRPGIFSMLNPGNA